MLEYKRDLGNIGRDPQPGFDIDRLDKNWKELIDLVGVTDRQMQKKETRDFVFDFVEKRGGVDNVIREIKMEMATASRKELKKTAPQAIVVSCENKIPDRPSEYAKKEHLDHIGWDPQPGFDIDRLEENWKELLDLAGVTNEQMQKKEIRDFVFDFVEKRGGVDNVVREIKMEMATASRKQMKKTVPQAIVVSCEKKFPDRPSQYAGKEFHGSLTRDKAESLLSKAYDGGYLVRKVGTSPGKFVLSLRYKDSIIAHYVLSYKGGIHYAGTLAFENFEDLVNEILAIRASCEGKSVVNGRGGGGEKDRKKITSDDDEVSTSSARKHGSDVDVGGNVSEPEESIWDQFTNAIKRNTPKATKILCQMIPKNKPAHFGNEFHGSLSAKEAEKIVSQYEDGHYLVRESINDDAPCFALTFRFFGSNKHFSLEYDGKMHYVGERGFESLHDLVNDGLTSMYLEMCTQTIFHQVKGSYSETRVETPSDSCGETALISSEQDSMEQRGSNHQTTLDTIFSCDMTCTKCESEHFWLKDGEDEKSLVVPNEVLLGNSDANQVVVRLLESLSLEHEELKEPNPETKCQIRCLCLQAKSVQRLDVVQRLREIAPAGTTGPLLPEACDVEGIPIRQREKLTIHLCGGNEWQLLAERLGLSPAEIRFLDNRVINPCDAALTYARKQDLVRSVGELYDMLVECDFPVWADLL